MINAAKLLFLTIIAFCTYPQRGEAQNAPAYGNYSTSPMSLAIGDTVPEFFYRIPHEVAMTVSGQSLTISLDQFRDRLIILDFWATWCGPCIATLGRLNDINKEFDDEIVVIPVSYEQASTGAKVWKRDGWDYLAIVRDSVLGKTFPTQTLPHQVWIKGGKVIAMPKSDYVTAENIQLVLQGEDPSSLLYMHTDAGDIDPLKPVFVEGNGKTRKYYDTPETTIAGFLPGHRARKLDFYVAADTSILCAVNLPLQELFFRAYKYEVFQPWAGDLVASQPNSVILEVSDNMSQRLTPPYGLLNKGELSKDSAFAAWELKNLFGYNLRIPQLISDTLARKYMQEDLNFFFGMYLGLQAVIEHRQEYRYPVLRNIGPADQTRKYLTASSPPVDLDQKSNLVMKELPYGQGLFYTHLDISLQHAAGSEFTAPLVDSTGIPADLNVNFHFPKAMRNGWTLEAINRELKRYGMHVVTETRKVPVLVIREHDYAKQ
ncbi:TlpA family protein disulfide reductase [Parapedobacter soli]|uniref:TlpA family protein disulfide reductase n=1 Tax=Parapedobacter soli TaxID=416955 RepID=UPI0021C62142|nr:TlpA disulfide reductase family protein [Parapedobacter soli]